MIIDGNKLIPDDGKWLYNGEICSDIVYLGKNASAEQWWEVDEYIKPPEDVHPEDDEISDTEALEIIRGGAV